MVDSDPTRRAEELQEELRAVLAQGPPDYARVLALSTELAKLDPDNVRFFADAGLISRLGTELVSRKETALAELVKNAYDADATRVDVLFSDADEPGGELEIRDNGTGMSRRTLVEGFMRLSSTLKVSEPISPRYKRQRAGRKGIGRFAVQRLGRQFVVTTQTLDAPSALRVEIDWDQFRGGQDLTTVASRVEEVEKEREEGTTLWISDLRDGWTNATVRRAFRYVSGLLQPFPVRALSKQAKQREEADPGFTPHFFRVDSGDIETIADEGGQFFDLALAEIRGSVDANGRGRWSITSRQFPEIDEALVPLGREEDDPSVPFSALRSIDFRAYYYISQAGLLPRASSKIIREWLRSQGGIRVYRNGFRVLPYGNPNNDWIGNDYAEAKRRILPPFGNQNFYGIVELTDPEGVLFEETASREGLIENEAFEELRLFVFRVMRAAVLRVAEARETKRIAPGREGQIETPPEERILKATRLLLGEAASQDGDAQDQADEIARGVADLQRVREELLNELGMLRVLASLGIVIGEFTHEIRHLLPAVVADARLLEEQLGGTDLGEAAADLHGNVNQFRTYASYFDRAARENATRELVVHEVGTVTEQFARVLRPASLRLGVRLAAESEGAGLYSTPMHPSEWSSVLFNFYSNAQKAVRRARPEQGRILIRAGRLDDRVYLDFSDNGDGVAPAYRDRIFNPFFTTSTHSGDPFESDDELEGSGLGLKIVRDIARSYGGDVSLVEPPPTYVTSFRFEVPAATDDDILASDAY
jgi:signal transduction histidine kinase